MKLFSKSKNFYFPDVYIFLVIIPLISGFNYYLTYSNPQFNLFLALTFTIDTVQGYLSILGVREVILFLDRRMPYQSQLLKRILIQTATTMFVGLSIISLLTELVSLIARGEFVSFKFYSNALPIISIWFFVVNGIYIILFFYKEWRSVNNQQSQFEQQIKEGLLVKKGNTIVKLGFQDILGFTVDGDYSICHDKSGNKYYIEEPLAKMHESVPSLLFFRVNRQYIIHRDLIKGFNRGANGKIIAQIKESPFESEITISRTKAPEFKKWLHKV